MAAPVCLKYLHILPHSAATVRTADIFISEISYADRIDTAFLKAHLLTSCTRNKLNIFDKKYVQNYTLQIIYVKRCVFLEGSLKIE